MIAKSCFIAFNYTSTCINVKEKFLPDVKTGKLHIRCRIFIKYKLKLTLEDLLVWHATDVHTVLAEIEWAMEVKFVLNQGVKR